MGSFKSLFEMSRKNYLGNQVAANWRFKKTSPTAAPVSPAPTPAPVATGPRKRVFSVSPSGHFWFHQPKPIKKAITSLALALCLCRSAFGQTLTVPRDSSMPLLVPCDGRNILNVNAALLGSNTPSAYLLLTLTTNESFSINTNVLIQSGSSASTLNTSMSWDAGYLLKSGSTIQVAGAWTNQFWIEGYDANAADNFDGDIFIASNSPTLSSTLANGGGGFICVTTSGSFTNASGTWINAGGIGFSLTPPLTLWGSYTNLIPAYTITGNGNGLTNISAASITATNAPSNGAALRYTNGLFYWAP